LTEFLTLKTAVRVSGLLTLASLPLLLSKRIPLNSFSKTFLIAAVIGNSVEKTLFGGVVDWILLGRFSVSNLADLYSFLGGITAFAQFMSYAWQLPGYKNDGTQGGSEVPHPSNPSDPGSSNSPQPPTTHTNILQAA
jgi:hypothetical protein